MTVKVAINGFGRIGRCIFRSWLAGDNKDIDIVHINDLSETKTLAHLLKYDSIHSTLRHKVSVYDNVIEVAGKKITITAEKDPRNLPWKEKSVDVVHECSGIFRSKETASYHLEAGDRKSVV